MNQIRVPHPNRIAPSKAERKIYDQSTTREKAEHGLNRLGQKRGKKYPKIITSWRRNWENLTTMHRYPAMIRRVIWGRRGPKPKLYTKNAIEAFHRQLRRVIKTKGSFTSDTSLMKLLFIVQRDITSKWQKLMHNWNRILSESRYVRILVS